jgi:hypothetical protein
LCVQDYGYYCEYLRSAVAKDGFTYMSPEHFAQWLPLPLIETSLTAVDAAEAAERRRQAGQMSITSYMKPLADVNTRPQQQQIPLDVDASPINNASSSSSSQDESTTSSKVGLGVGRQKRYVNDLQGMKEEDLAQLCTFDRNETNVLVRQWMFLKLAPDAKAPGAPGHDLAVVLDGGRLGKVILLAFREALPVEYCVSGLLPHPYSDTDPILGCMFVGRCVAAKSMTEGATIVRSLSDALTLSSQLKGSITKTTLATKTIILYLPLDRMVGFNQMYESPRGGSGGDVDGQGAGMMGGGISEVLHETVFGEARQRDILKVDASKQRRTASKKEEWVPQFLLYAHKGVLLQEVLSDIVMDGFWARSDPIDDERPDWTCAYSDHNPETPWFLMLKDMRHNRRPKSLSFTSNLSQKAIVIKFFETFVGLVQQELEGRKATTGGRREDEQREVKKSAEVVAEVQEIDDDARDEEDDDESDATNLSDAEKAFNAVMEKTGEAARASSLVRFMREAISKSQVAGTYDDVQRDCSVIVQLVEALRKGDVQDEDAAYEATAAQLKTEDMKSVLAQERALRQQVVVRRTSEASRRSVKSDAGSEGGKKAAKKGAGKKTPKRAAGKKAARGKAKEKLPPVEEEGEGEEDEGDE